MRGPAMFAAGAFLAVARLAIARPANDDCANATVVTSLPFTDTLDTTAATAEAGEPEVCEGGDHGVWYRIPAQTAEALFWASTAGSTGSEFRVTQFSGSCGALTSFACEVTMNEFPEVGIAPLGQDVLVRVNGSGTLALGVKRLPEFLVGYPGGRYASVAGGPGGFLVASDEFDFPGVWGRLFDANGAPLGPLFAVSNDDENDYVDVAAAGTGSFVVVWEGSAGVQAARVDGPGTVVALPVAAAGRRPHAAADADGNFVVAWEATDGSFRGVFARRFDSEGVALGPAFQVNTYTTGFQEYSAVAMAPGGEFVVAWSDDDVKARLFDSTGTPLGSEFVVNAYTNRDQREPAVGMDAAGNFVVAWYGGEDGDGLYGPLAARRFTATGVPLGGDFPVNTDPDLDFGRYLEMAMAPAGEFVVTWQTWGRSSVHRFSDAVVARRFESDGTPSGPQFFAGSLVKDYQYDPDVGVTPDGTFMVVWGDFRNFFNFSFRPEREDESFVARVLPDASSPCAPVPLSDCRRSTVPSRSKLALIDARGSRHDVMRWTWADGEATDVSAFGDPPANDGYLLCLYDGSAALVFDATAPAGGRCGKKPCWKGTGKASRATGFRYMDGQRTPEGVQKLVLKAGIDGKAKVVVKGGGPNLSAGALGMPPLPLVFPARLQLQGPGGECWEAVFSPSGVTTNAPGEFAGKAG